MCTSFKLVFYLQQHLSLQHAQVFSLQHFDSLLLHLHFTSVITFSTFNRYRNILVLTSLKVN